MAEVKGVSPVEAANKTGFRVRKEPVQPERQLNPNLKTEPQKISPLDEPMPEGDPGTYTPDGVKTPHTPKQKSYN